MLLWYQAFLEEGFITNVSKRPTRGLTVVPLDRRFSIRSLMCLSSEVMCDILYASIRWSYQSDATEIWHDMIAGIQDPLSEKTCEAGCPACRAVCGAVSSAPCTLTRDQERDSPGQTTSTSWRPPGTSSTPRTGPRSPSRTSSISCRPGPTSRRTRPALWRTSRESSPGLALSPVRCLQQ